jgi:hypothetical protein
MRDAIPTRLMRRRGADYWRACKVLVNARNGRCGLENAVLESWPRPRYQGPKLSPDRVKS